MRRSTTPLPRTTGRTLLARALATLLGRRSAPPSWAIASSWLDAADDAPPAAFVEQWQEYLQRLQAADAEHPDAATWQAIAALGATLLAAEADGLPGVDWAALRTRIAADHNTLGNALDTQGDKQAALAAFARAVDLQPDFAMWRRNQAGTLIELGRLADARRPPSPPPVPWNPDAPRLPQLAADLAAAEEAAQSP